jgi:outer membrane protein OmpA-like peptidoglycan-associated protein
MDPQPLNFSSDSFTCGHPSLSKDGQVMYFASDMPGGYGGKDLYFVTYSKRSKEWGDPVNLGPTINTAGDEVYPFIHEDGTLYFSSNGHIGLGGTDIYFSKGSATDWSTPLNMKSPINSGGDDFSLILSKDKESGYFTSNREGGKGQDDIYRFYMTPLVFTLHGIVRDSKTKEIMVNTILTIINSNDSAKLVIKTDAAGYYKISLKPRTDYELFGAHEDYYDSKIEFQTTKGLEVSTDLEQDLLLEPFDYSTVFTLEGILYDLDKANIRPDAALVLDTMVYLLNKYPKIRIELGSHTDCRADSAHNQDLSQRRADSAVAYIVRSGIDPDRMIAKGYGEAKLVNDCGCEGTYITRNCTEAEHQLNRRTTFKLLDNKYIPKNKQEMKNNADKTKTPEQGTGKPNKPGTQTPPRK